MVTSESVVLALELVTGRVLRIVVARLISAYDSRHSLEAASANGLNIILV